VGGRIHVHSHTFLTHLYAGLTTWWCRLCQPAFFVRCKLWGGANTRTKSFDPLQRDHLASDLLNMARKRLPSDDAADPLPPRKSARLLTRPGDDGSSGPSKTVTPRPDDNDSPGPSKTATTIPGGASSRGKTLSGSALVQEVTKMVEKDNAEIMILELMRKYSFDLSHLQKLLRRKANQP
jgi:hypothetical protein